MGKYFYKIFKYRYLVLSLGSIKVDEDRDLNVSFLCCNLNSGSEIENIFIHSIIYNKKMNTLTNT